MQEVFDSDKHLDFRITSLTAKVQSEMTQFWGGIRSILNNYLIQYVFSKKLTRLLGIALNEGNPHERMHLLRVQSVRTQLPEQQLGIAHSQ